MRARKLVRLLTAVLTAGLAALASARSPADLATAPLPSETAVISRIGFGSCADQRLPQPIWQPILADQPELFLMLGDNVYGDVSSAEMIELRQAYAKLAEVLGFRQLRASVPMLSIWDDHDFGRNDAGGDFPYRLQAAALFREFWQVPSDSPRGRREGLQDAVIIGPAGRRLQIILLDMRSFRSPLKPTDSKGERGKERYLPDDDPTKTLLGNDQWTWLSEQLSLPAEVRLIASSIQVLAEGHGWERWGNLPLERERLIRLIGETRASGVIFLSGDRHIAGLYRRTLGAPYPLYEISSSSLNRPFSSSGEQDPLQLGAIYPAENYGFIRINWEAEKIALELEDSAGAVVRSVTIDLAELKAR